jgi:hypothetical protein
MQLNKKLVTKKEIKENLNKGVKICYAKSHI